MVRSQKIFLLFILLAQPLIFASDFIEQEVTSTKTTKTKRQSLSQARRQAADSLETIAHELTAQTALAAEALDAILWDIRHIVENDKDSTFMSVLQEQRDKVLASLKTAEKDAQERTKKLKELNKLLKPSN